MLGVEETGRASARRAEREGGVGWRIMGEAGRGWKPTPRREVEGRPAGRGGPPRQKGGDSGHRPGGEISVCRNPKPPTHYVP